MALTSKGRLVIGSLTEDGRLVIGSLTETGEQVVGVSSGTEYLKTLTANVVATAKTSYAYVASYLKRSLNKFRLKHYSLHLYDDDD